MSRRTLTLLTGAGLLAAAFLFADRPPDGADAAADRSNPPARSVLVAEATSTRDVRELRLRGVTRSARRAQVSFLLGGRLAERPVEVGDRVDAGAVLARLDARELRHAVEAAEARSAEAEARRAQAERDLARAESLVEAKAATAEELELARTGVDAARAAAEAATTGVAEARRQLAESTLSAPFAATVTEVAGEPGEWIGGGRPVVTLAGTGEVEVEVEAPATAALRITAGMPVRVELPGAGIGPLEGRVRTVGRTAAGPGRLFPVVVDLGADSAAVAGLAAEILVELDRGETVSVPVEAVIDPGGRRPAVLRVADGRVEKVEVRVDGLRGERVVVVGRLVPGDRVVVGGHRGLLDGEAVEVVR